MIEPVTIVGGGLSGLTLAIGLRQQGVPVTVWETGEYPRHRVCGEFISGRGQDTLARLGLLDGLKSAGMGSASSVQFYVGKKMVARHRLPRPALCVSRYQLDEWLALEFQRIGGDLRTSARFTGKYHSGIVRASGRRPHPMVRGNRWFGLKVHAHNVALDADLEMHIVQGGYVGLCRLPGGQVNVCGLFRSTIQVENLRQQWRNWLEGPKNSALSLKMTRARYDESSFCSIAALNLDPQLASECTQWSVGDALTMIPPLSGNGMSMAFESAELAIQPLLQFSLGNCAWALSRGEYIRACEETFHKRLRWAKWLHRAMFLPGPAASLLLWVTHSMRCARAVFERTR